MPASNEKTIARTATSAADRVAREAFPWWQHRRAPTRQGGVMWITAVVHHKTSKPQIEHKISGSPSKAEVGNGGGVLCVALDGDERQ